MQTNNDCKIFDLVLKDQLKIFFPLMLNLHNETGSSQ